MHACSVASVGGPNASSSTRRGCVSQLRLGEGGVEQSALRVSAHLGPAVGEAFGLVTGVRVTPHEGMAFAAVDPLVMALVQEVVVLVGGASPGACLLLCRARRSSLLGLEGHGSHESSKL